MLETKEEKKSLLITMGLFALLFLVLFFFGLSYLDPATEQGIAINFGTSEAGKGVKQSQEKIKITPPSASDAAVEESLADEAIPEDSQDTSLEKEEVVTQQVEEAPVIKSNEKVLKKTPTPTKSSIKTTSEKKEAKKETKAVEKKPDASTQNILDSFLKGAKQDGKTAEGDGDTKQNGDQGNPDGDPNAKAYYGTGKGLDGDGNYRLGGRKALNKEREIPKCNETGIVVVKIVVNQQGKVIEAYPGIKGTTNTAPCLVEPAKNAALATKFNSDPNAPSKQIGSIVYKFKLSE